VHEARNASIAGRLDWRPPPRLPGAGITDRSIGVAVNVIVDFPPGMLVSVATPRPGDVRLVVVDGTLTGSGGCVDGFLAMGKDY
jgi:hypothetical protein